MSGVVIDQTAEIVLTPDEMYALASSLRLPAVMGLQDPFQGARAEEMSAHLELAREQLTRRGLLTRTDQGRLVPTAEVAEMLKLNAGAPTTLAVARTPSNGPAEVCLIHGRQARFMAQTAAPDTGVVLSAVPDITGVLERVLEHAAVPDADPASGQGCVLPAHELSRVRTLLGDGEAEQAGAVLQRAVANADSAQVLLDTLAGRHESGSLAVLRREPRRITHGERLAWLVGSSGAWRAELSDDRHSLIRLTPTSGSAIRRRLQAIVHGATR